MNRWPFRTYGSGEDDEPSNQLRREQEALFRAPPAYGSTENESVSAGDQVTFGRPGIATGIYQREEDRAFIEAKLAEFQHRLDTQYSYKTLSASTKVPAYELAFGLNPAYVQNETFRLAFLRADRFDVQAAVRRFVGHFELKLELFGKKLLGREITQDDLDPDTLKCLYSGWMQDLPVRDANGRLISCVFNQLYNPDISPTFQMQCIFYGNMALRTNDAESQRRGRVLIAWYSGGVMDRNTIWQMARIMPHLPIHVAAFHSCLISDSSTTINHFLTLAYIGTQMLHRDSTRIHSGSMLELKYALQTCGIQANSLPITDDGEVILEAHIETWAKIRESERTICNAKVAHTVGPIHR